MVRKPTTRRTRRAPAAARQRRHPRTFLTDPRSGPWVVLAALLLLAGSASAWYVKDALLPHENHAHDAAPHTGVDGHDGHAHDHVARAGLPAVTCPANARVPEAIDRPALDNLPALAIRGDAGFTPASGVRSGSGTAEDPFVISGIRTPSLVLSDTTAYFLLAGSDVGTLVLDWTGKGGLVCKNHVGDLRVNRNVERVEAPSAGIIEGNRIDVVGQIRHYDGVFRGNEVGTPLRRGIVLNIDGMNGAEFTGNRILGGVDMKLHGHHHGRPGESHMHVADENVSGADDHTVRHVLFQFRGNTVEDPSGFGLRYNDLNHAGDDRTATSEATPALEKPHVHHTTVLVEENRVVGAPIRVEILNAKDERHLDGERASLVLRGNRVVGPLAGSGILVSAFRNADVLVEDNRIERQTVAGLVPLSLGTGAGIDLASAENATVLVVGNHVEGYTYGVRARDFAASTSWTVGENRFVGVRQDVWWDESVAKPPARG